MAKSAPKKVTKKSTPKKTNNTESKTPAQQALDNIKEHPERLRKFLLLILALVLISGIAFAVMTKQWLDHAVVSSWPQAQTGLVLSKSQTKSSDNDSSTSIDLGTNPSTNLASPPTSVRLVSTAEALQPAAPGNSSISSPAPQNTSVPPVGSNTSPTPTTVPPTNTPSTETPSPQEPTPTQTNLLSPAVQVVTNALGQPILRVSLRVL